MFAVAVIVAAAALAAQDDHHPPPFDAKGTALEPLTKLVGEWSSTDQDRLGRPDVHVSYKVTSNGSAVLETLFPGDSGEMVTMYTLDDGKVIMTHYCALGNQPRLVGAPMPGKPNVIVFTLVDGLNLDAGKDEYMGKMTLTIIDDDHMTQEWRHFEGPTEMGGVTFELTRLRSGMR